MPNDFIYELTDPVSPEKGLYWDSLKGTRSERADILKKLLHPRVMAVTFIRKTDITKVRLAICTRNGCWTKYDPEEEARQDARVNAAAAASGNTKISTSRTKTIYETGVIPVYDVIKGDWISFDVDHVKTIQGVISAGIDSVWDTRQKLGKRGIMRIPAAGGAMIHSSGAGGGGGGGEITSAINWPGAVPGPIFTISAGGGVGVLLHPLGGVGRTHATEQLVEEQVKYKLTKGQEDWLDRLHREGEIVKIDKEDIKPIEISNTINFLADWIQAITRAGGGGIR